MIALQWNVPGMKTARAPRWMTESPARLAQAGVRRCLAATVCMTQRGATFEPGVLAGKATRRLRIERRDERDLDRAERSADRTQRLRARGDLLELLGVETRCRGGRGELDQRNVETLTIAAQMDARGRVDRGGRVSGPGEPLRERHRE